jgi:hypothetical protein
MLTYRENSIVVPLMTCAESGFGWAADCGFCAARPLGASMKHCSIKRAFVAKFVSDIRKIRSKEREKPRIAPRLLN